jgi:hypothetical protein
MFTVCVAQMHAGFVVLVVHSAAMASSSALPDAHPDRHIRQTTSLAGHYGATALARLCSAPATALRACLVAGARSGRVASATTGALGNALVAKSAGR